MNSQTQMKPAAGAMLISCFMERLLTLNLRLVFHQEKEEFVFDHVWSFLQVWFFVNEIFVFNFQACVLKEKNLQIWPPVCLSG